MNSNSFVFLIVSQWDNEELHFVLDEALSHFVLHVHVWLDSHFVGLWICTNLRYLYHCSFWGLKEEFWISLPGFSNVAKILGWLL